MKKVFLSAIAVALISMQTVSYSATDTAAEIATKESENATLTADITKLNTDIEATKLEIAQLQQQIDDSDTLIKGLSTDISSNKEKLKERILDMYLSGSASNIEVILGATSVDDFLNRLEYVSIIAESDSKLIGDLTQQVNVSTKANKTLKNSLATLNTKQKDLEGKRTEFQSILQANQDRLNYLYAQDVAISDSHEGEDGAVNSGNILSYYDKLQLNANNANNNGNKAPVQKPTQKPVQRPTQKPVQKPTQKPVQKPTQRPTQKPTTGSNSNSGSNSTIVVKPKPVPTPTQPPINNNQGGSNTPIAGGYVWPVPGFYHLTSLWDEDRGSSNHGALDIASAGVDGANVVAARAGIVDVAENYCVHNWGKDSSCGCGGGYGNWVRIDHGDGYTTIYAHMSSITVGYGDYVEAGQLLGFVGSTGYSTGAHLHYETRYDNVKYNPLDEYPNINVTY